MVLETERVLPMKKYSSLAAALLGLSLVCASPASAEADKHEMAIVCKKKTDAETIAKALYETVRTLDRKGFDTIFALKKSKRCWSTTIVLPPFYVSLARFPSDESIKAVCVVIEVPAKGIPNYGVIFEIAKPSADA